MSLVYHNKSQEQKEYYNRTAEKYDQWHVETASAKVVDAWNFKNLRNFIGEEKLKKGLDLGCGTGRLANSLFQVTEEVHGLDQSKKVLEIAARKFSQLQLKQGEVINMPYADEEFDLVVINGSLHHFFAMIKTFEEVYRVLKPGGHFAILGEPNLLYTKKYNPFFYLWFLIKGFGKLFTLLRKNKDKTPAEMIEPEAELFHPGRMQKALKKVGFAVASFYTYDYIPRSESKFFLKHYAGYLNFERKYISPVFKNLGSAIQCFSIKVDQREK
jgi:demethylmenaquinone methyltransferase / 2-methoxy-6-polyprenyl-1,4-benzoquinol methylase